MSGSGVILILIPTEKHEKCLLQKKKKVTIDERPMSPTGSELKKVESTHPDYQSMEKIIKLTLEQLEISNTTWTKTDDKNHYQIMFPIECGTKCEDMLEILREHDIGKKLNSKISVMPCSIHYHGNSLNENEEFLEDETILDKENEIKNSGWNIFVSSVKSRLTVAQVVENVRVHAAITFDFIMLLLISTTLCALGLVENDKICMLSSMLISPMMGPVMAGTFGTVIRDKHLQKIGVRNELIGLGIATLVGFCYGSIICVITDRYGTSDWPTYEMYSRGVLRSLWVGALIALLSGAAVALGILSDNIASLVGVAISTSLMPPAVNAGLLWSLGFVYYLKGDVSSRYTSITHTDYYSNESFTELLTLGAVSICLTFVNIVCIYAAGILVFKIKEVAPNSSKDQARRNFWKHDIKETRNYNKTFHNDSFNYYQTLLNSRKLGDMLHFSTDLSKENFRENIKRPQYTWSPCSNLINSKNESTPSKLLHIPIMKTRNESYNGQYRRLSQIFPRSSDAEENLKVIKEKVSEKSPLLKSGGSGGSGMSIGRKFIVTPCQVETTPLLNV
ncbi:uncharacterized protein LOC115885405 [Sitophilus oryzae]|uniref:Uncharacterized protein LOC115885405 n=1 Tax=Sitophilus oryzae TaxID=7048 RepID=A0A6J2YB68_SITOR|nr:uncharacterized protein LOC115885405 [Sitophilus oryzae]